MAAVQASVRDVTGRAAGTRRHTLAIIVRNSSNELRHYHKFTNDLAYSNAVHSTDSLSSTVHID